MISLRRVSKFLAASCGSKPQTRPLTVSLFKADREKAGYDKAASDDFAEENDFRFFAKETKNPASQYRSDLLDEMKKASGEPGELPGSGKADNQKKTNQKNQQ
eukprot:TRINITY_DN8612_c0_g1_i1.p2 TRINITY_DN8612_c0_g1~~TRINITY_DN8612_c0_g1_i1.p2  ORF type:complete len:103 (+),score=23.87 TRINITY_DN8612_c0_g1_i1:25-333(+)